MDEQFIRERITTLRIAAHKSEREMSLDLGHSASYTNSITSGRISPSLREFLYICEYLEITPDSFFAEGGTLPHNIARIVSMARLLDESDQLLLLEIIDRFVTAKK